MKLSKDDLMVSKDHFEIKELKDIDGEVALRYLTQSEITEIRKLESAGIGTFESSETGAIRGRRRNKGQYQNVTKINTVKQMEASQNAKLLAIRYAMSCDGVTYTKEEVNQFKPVYIDAIYDVIKDMNSLGENVEEDIDDFLEDE
jgi:hypothetical protein